MPCQINTVSGLCTIVDWRQLIALLLDQTIGDTERRADCCDHTKEVLHKHLCLTAAYQALQEMGRHARTQRGSICTMPLKISP